MENETTKLFEKNGFRDLQKMYDRGVLSATTFGSLWHANIYKTWYKRKYTKFKHKKFLYKPSTITEINKKIPEHVVNISGLYKGADNKKHLMYWWSGAEKKYRGYKAVFTQAPYPIPPTYYRLHKHYEEIK